MTTSEAERLLLGTSVGGVNGRHDGAKPSLNTLIANVRNRPDELLKGLDGIRTGSPTFDQRKIRGRRKLLLVVV